MTELDPLKKYRHDIKGKLPLIETALSYIDEANYLDQNQLELYTAIHEAIIAMLTSSKDFLDKNFEDVFEIEMNKKDKKPQKNLNYTTEFTDGKLKIKITEDKLDKNSLVVLKTLFSERLQ